jgi:hypothetical protein
LHPNEDITIPLPVNQQILSIRVQVSRSRTPVFLRKVMSLVVAKRIVVPQDSLRMV